MEKAATLQDVFNKYTGNKEMDGKTFAKLAKDCGLLDKQLTTTDVDLVFTKCKTSSAVRTITFQQFQNGIKQIAEKKKVDQQVVSDQITKNGGPVFEGTKGASKFHDDKSTYTGMYKDNQQQQQQQSQQQHQNKEEEKKGSGGGHQQQQQQQQQKQQVVVESSSASSLQEVFNNFTAGQADMDGKTFAKLAKDCGILDKKLTPTDMDLIFAKIKAKDARKINFQQFQNGVKQCADKKGVAQNVLEETLMKNGGPKFSGTKADKVKFHDDKNLYTGVYAQGGPSTVDKKVNDLSGLCDRTDADVRGVKK